LDSASLTLLVFTIVAIFRRKRRSLEQVEIEAGWEDSRGRRTSNRKRLVKLMERAMLQVTIGKTVNNL
jgi:hypothetical protein